MRCKQGLKIRVMFGDRQHALQGNVVAPLLILTAACRIVGKGVVIKRSIANTVRPIKSRPCIIRRKGMAVVAASRALWRTIGSMLFGWIKSRADVAIAACIKTPITTTTSTAVRVIVAALIWRLPSASAWRCFKMPTAATTTTLSIGITAAAAMTAATMDWHSLSWQVAMAIIGALCSTVIIPAAKNSKTIYRKTQYAAFVGMAVIAALIMHRLGAVAPSFDIDIIDAALAFLWRFDSDLRALFIGYMMPTIVYIIPTRDKWLTILGKPPSAK